MHFNEDPYERVGRYVEDGFGRQVIVHMPRVSWAYLDWIADNVEGADIRQFFIDNDLSRLPADGSIHDWMEGAVRKTYLLRERDGRPRPEWCPPAHPFEFLELSS